MKLSVLKYTLFVSIVVFLVACSEVNEDKSTLKTALDFKITNRFLNRLSKLSTKQSLIAFNAITNTNKTEEIYSSTFKARSSRPINKNLEDISLRNAALNSTENPTVLVQESFSAIPQPKEKSKWGLRIIFDNDIWNNTDYYYTNGVNIELITQLAKSSPINKILLGAKKADIEINGFSIRQNMYTPTNPDVSEILNNDRPFAAFLTIGHFRQTYDLKKKIHFNSRLEAGVLGPASLGGTIQSGLHEEEPVGWQNQIQNSFVLNYYTQFEKGLLQLPNFELNATAQASIGTLFNQLGAGFYARFGRFFPFYRGPFKLAGTADKKSPLQIWFFASGNANITAYDATLQGGLFKSENPYTIQNYELKKLVFQASAGIAVYSGKLGLELENFFLTPEFSEGKNFGWGRIKLIASF